MAERPWTDIEKIKLLEALKKHGPYNLGMLHQELHDRSPAEIFKFCRKYDLLAQKRIDENITENNSVTAWLRIFNNVKDLHPEELHDIIPRVLKYIALFEDRSDIDFNIADCYLWLSDATSGIAPRALEGDSSWYLDRCLAALAETMKIGSDNVKEFLKHTKNIAERSSFAPSALNPLNIPPQMLLKEPWDKIV